jgi:hypothetical protein
MDNSPFYLVDYEGSFSVCLQCDGKYRRSFFDEFEEKGFCGGNGYDFEAAARVFADENMPEIEIDFDPEAGMFCALFDSRADAEKFLTAFKAAVENDNVFRSLLRKAELE